MKLPRRAVVTSSIAAGGFWGLTAALLLSGPLFELGAVPAVITMAVVAVAGAVAATSIPAWWFTQFPVAKLNDQAASGRTADIVDQAALAFGLTEQRVYTVVIDTSVANCGAFPLRGGDVVIWVTSGLADMLSQHQLEAVLFAQIAIASDSRMRRAAVNEILIRLSMTTFALTFVFFMVSPAMAVLPFLAFALSWRAEYFAFARGKAADAVAARTTLLPDDLVDAYDTLGNMTLERHRIYLATFVDPFALTATGAESRKLVNNRLVASTTGVARATLKARAANLRSLLTGEDAGPSLTELTFQETMATELAEQPAARWFPDPFFPDAGRERKFMQGQWAAITRQSAPVLVLGRRPDPNWSPDPHRFEPGMMRWWDGQQWTGHTHPPCVQPGTLPPDSKPFPPPGVS